MSDAGTPPAASFQRGGIMVRKLPVVAAAVVTATLLAGVDSAQAGCFAEFDECGECVVKRFRENLTFWGYIDGVRDGIDCEIDLYHCIVLGAHHKYDCN